jgi:hypothetical protein
MNVQQGPPLDYPSSGRQPPPVGRLDSSANLLSPFPVHAELSSTAAVIDLSTTRRRGRFRGSGSIRMGIAASVWQIGMLRKCAANRTASPVLPTPRFRSFPDDSVDITGGFSLFSGHRGFTEKAGPIGRPTTRNCMLG